MRAHRGTVVLQMVMLPLGLTVEMARPVVVLEREDGSLAFWAVQPGQRV